MNIGAILLIALGVALIVMGWQGTYASVWSFVSGSTGGAGGGQSQQPAQQNPPRTTLAHGGQHVG